MKKALLTAAALLVGGPAFAQTMLPNPSAAEAGAPRPARAHGISTALAVEAAMDANAICLGNGFKTTALIVDADGVPIAMISNDGAAAITQRIAMGKAAIVIKTKMTSGDAAAKAKTDPAFATMLTTENLGVARQGAVPIKMGADVIGAFSVSGSPGGDKDEVCVNAALAKIQGRIK